MLCALVKVPPWDRRDPSTGSGSTLTKALWDLASLMKTDAQGRGQSVASSSKAHVAMLRELGLEHKTTAGACL